MAVLESGGTSGGNEGNNNNNSAGNGNDKNPTTSEASTSGMQKMNSKKKKEPNEKLDPCPDDHDYEDKKRRNSLSDSPLTELSAASSSPASNGDSADDTGNEGVENCKQGSSGEPTASKNRSTSFAGIHPIDYDSMLQPCGLEDQYECNSKPGAATSQHIYELVEAENIDNMELENVYEICAGVKKLIKQLKYNKWTEALCSTIFSGDFNGFLRRFKLIMMCLRKRKPQYYSRMSNQDLAASIAQNIVEPFYDHEVGASILMILLASHDKNKTCASGGHGFCRIAHMLLKLLRKDDLARLAEVTDKRTGKTALHMVVTTGNQCQLRVLLALTDMNPNMVDKSGRAPIHYAVERNNLEMIKMLMWYGADVSMVMAGNAKYDSLFISLRANPSGTVNHWLHERIKALSHKMMQFATKLSKPHVHVAKELSTIHFIHLSHNITPTNIECQLNLHEKKNLSALCPPPRNNMRSILFMVPIAFQSPDVYSAAADPKVVRLPFPDNLYITGSPILDQANDVAAKLTNMFEPIHNGYFYAYELPSEIEGLQRLNLRLGTCPPPSTTTGQAMDVAGCSQQQSPPPPKTTIIAVQAFLCADFDRNKTKLD